jgi:sugar lactone lactonase YvrE
VLEFARGTGFTDGQNAAVVIGQPNFTSHTNATTQNGLSVPGGVTFDSKGNLYVAEEGNCRVLEFKAQKGKFATNQKAKLVLGQPNFTSNTCAVTQTNLQNPNGIAFGP